MADLKYKRVLLKLSGEALMGDEAFGISPDVMNKIAEEINQVIQTGVELAIVVGGGNIFRGVKGSAKLGVDQASGDYVGMLATVMNCIYAADMFRTVGLKTRIMSPFVCGNVTELFTKDLAVEALNRQEVVFFAGGTGHPYFSTDTGVMLRAIEVEADVILLAKAIDGVYDDDPRTNPVAKKYDEVSIDEVVAKNLQVVDMTASILAKENKMPMWVFGLNEENSIVNTIKGKFNGTKVTV